MKKNFDSWVYAHPTLKRLIMQLKIVLFITVISVSNVFASSVYSQVAMVSLDMEDKTLEQVMDEIERQSEFYFIFNQKQIDVSRVVDIKVDNKLISDILPELFKGTEVHYAVIDRKILLTRDPIEDNLSSNNSGVEQQQNNVSGKVSDINGVPLPGVNVLIKGSTIGVNTDIEGRYTIGVTDLNSTLVFSFIGLKPQEIALSGRRSLDVILEEELTSLDEVVVTALGIKRATKSLGYATSSIPPEQTTVNRTTNFINSLEGKVAGVNITSLGTGAGGTSKIRIRGQSSFGGNNSPLIVVNGVPIDNTNFGARGDVSQRGSNRTSDGGDGLSSINPDNIESMTVLKGAAASALYGSRAKDGVIMITTKTRGSGTGLSVELNTNYTSDTPLDFTDYQYEYGQGENGVRPTTPNTGTGQWSFGEKFQPGMTQILFDNIEVPYEPQRGQLTQYYRKGNSFTNTLTLSSGGENGGLNISLSNLMAESILPGSGYDRNNINVGFTQTIAKKLTVTGNMSYSNEQYTNPPNIGEQDYSPVVLFSMANSMPMDILEKYAFTSAGDEAYWSRFTNRTNPYFSLSRFDNIVRDRIFGNMTARYDITSWLYLQGRMGQDYYTRSQDYNLPTGSVRQPQPPPGFVNGQYVQDVYRFREFNADFLIGGKHAFGDIGLDATLGGNQMHRRLDRNNVLVQDFYQRGFYTLPNGRLLSPDNQVSERQVNSIYGSLELSYKGFIYLNSTIRNDWFSTLSAENRSILYPSLTASFVFSEAFKSRMPAWIDFGKIRFAFAQVGSDTDVAPYSNNLFYAINTTQFPNRTGATQPVGYINQTTVPNLALRPMTIDETEVGLEMKLFDNRLAFEFSYYYKISSDQILRSQISDASSYQTQLINVGESMNKGLEMLINISPLQTNSFMWDVSFNAAYNTSEVLSLGESASDNMITVGTGEFTGELRQVVGKPIGQLYGYGYLRDEQGRQIFDAGNGRPLRTASQIAFGSAVPIWTGGFTNTFNYKKVIFSFLIDFKLGNKTISGTNFNAWRHGLHKGTLVGREDGFVIGDGVNLNGQENTTKSGVQSFYETVRSQNIAEEFVYNGGLWQLRQLNLGYDFTNLVKGVKFIKGLRLNAVANNVAVLKKWIPNIHPEQFGFPSDNLVGLEATGLPITRSVGFNLNIKF
jgi:TonB-linked SusC/RagA family outer membrane protein